MKDGGERRRMEPRLGRDERWIEGPRTRVPVDEFCSLSRRPYRHSSRRCGPSLAVNVLEFCVLGIVVHLRLGNCIGYSLRELNAGIGVWTWWMMETHEQGILQRRDLETLRMDASLRQLLTTSR